MFCGAGGASAGIMQAAQELDMKASLFAIDRWDIAIETHSANFPAAGHLCQSVEHIDPVKVIPGQKLDLLWASPECTHHSNARGGLPRSEQGRASAWLLLKWLSELYVSRVIIENVAEFLSWGPLDAKGKPIKSLKGTIFKAFIESIRSLGYTVDWRILCSADYGDPTTRKRLFIQAVKGRKRIFWPEITHMDGDANLMGYQRWRPARDIIDWSVPGQSIFARKKPLAENTIKRISAGIQKYWGYFSQPFLAVLYGRSDSHSLDSPLSAITGHAHHALVASNRCALLDPFVLNVSHYSSAPRLRPVSDPLSTVVAKAEHCLVAPGIPFDITFRMLKPHELMLAHSFPPGYALKGNSAKRTLQIGNSVPVKLAKALAKQIMD